MRRPVRNRGFTLIELLLVLIIVATLAMVAGHAIFTSEAQLRSQVFNVVADFKRARFEAVKRGREVLVDLIQAGETDDDGIVSSADGYRICLDRDSDDNCDTADELIAETDFTAPVAYYDQDFPPPLGPDRTVTNEPWPADPDGIFFTGNRFVMHPDGFGNKAGTVYLYVPASPAGIGAGPMAVVLSGVGRLRVSGWRAGEGKWRR